MSPSSRIVGLDFGTTNTAIAVADDGGEPRLVRHAVDGGYSSTFRSLLYFDEAGEREDKRVLAGPAAVAAYLSAEEPGRLMQSLKSFLGSTQFDHTDVAGRRFSLEELIGMIVLQARQAAETQFGDLGTRAVVGRPVVFRGAVGAEGDALAERRLRKALTFAGFHDVEFEFEPMAAAREYQRRLESTELTLIADFGGGTTDFCLLRLDPPRGEEVPHVEVLGTGGVAVAGDAFDARMVRHLVAPGLGLHAEYRSELGKLLPMPRWIFGHLERWHHVSFLKTRKNLILLREIRRSSNMKARLGLLLDLVESNGGFLLHEAIAECKFELSSERRAAFSLPLGGASLDAEVARVDFENWIAEELEKIASCLDALLVKAGVSTAEVAHVFLTGGSSFVPAVRALFDTRFKKAKFSGGAELTTVATGLARAR